MPHLSDLDVLIVDCQTTGASPSFGSVLELGWCVVRPNQPELDDLQAHWIALPDGAVVSSRIRQLTGFEESAAAEALSPGDAWARLLASTGGKGSMPTAIHFARFELSFLRDWAERLAPDRAFPFDAICVHALACRLYPDLPRRTLRALAGHLGYGLDLSRRSLGHVQATAFIWRKLSAELATRGVHTWAQLNEFLAMPGPPSSRSGKRRYPVPSSVYRALPDEPGVYRFVRSNGDVLYIGKAASLKKRVASHFTAGVTKEHTLEMLTQVSDIQVTTTASALEAALLENESIKSLRPPYNVQLTGHDLPAWFANDSFDAASTVPDDIFRKGPLPSRSALSSLAALIALRSGAPMSASLRARALGVSELWLPDEAVFATGLAEFANRHLTGPSDSAALSVRRSVLAAAKKVLLAKPAAVLSDATETELAGTPPSNGDEWDPERVARHLERAAAQAYQVLRRASWLRMLHDCAIVYQEPDRAQQRLLIFQGGECVGSRDFVVEEPVSAPRPAARGSRHTFDRTKYDRLRVLTTELKRVCRDRGRVFVYIGRRQLGGSVLENILRLV